MHYFPPILTKSISYSLKNKHPAPKSSKPLRAKGFPAFEIPLLKLSFYLTLLSCKIRQEKIMPIVTKPVQVGTVLISSIQMYLIFLKIKIKSALLDEKIKAYVQLQNN